MKLRNVKSTVANVNILFNSVDYIQIIDRNIGDNVVLNCHKVTFNNTEIIVQTTMDISIDVYVSEHDRCCGTITLQIDDKRISFDFRREYVCLLESVPGVNYAVTLYTV